VPDAATVTGGAAAAAKIVLQPWATLEGIVADSLRTTQPQTITAFANQHVGHGSIVYRASAKLGADGVFRFAHVPPGEVAVGIEEKFERERTITTVMDHLVRLESLPGQRLEAKVGGAGEGVTGSVALPRGVEGDLASRFVFAQLRGLPVPPELLPKPDMEIKTLEQYEAWLKAFRETPAGRKFTTAEENASRSYAVRVQPDGTFNVKDVLPGRYALVVEVYDLNFGPSYGYGKAAASATKQVDVTETGDKCDVGVIQLEPPAAPRAR
jgi:hypothetical protein